MKHRLLHRLLYNVFLVLLLNVTSLKYSCIVAILYVPWLVSLLGLP